MKGNTAMNQRTYTELNKEKNVLDNLDLAPIKKLLKESDSGPMWSKEFTEAVEPMYRSFLYLLWKYPEEKIVPTPEVDVFWHMHILDTKKYAEDCETIFGRFIHHNPHKGLGGKSDLEDLGNKFARTLELIKIEFPELY
jgi:hypothetical protein